MNMNITNGQRLGTLLCLITGSGFLFSNTDAGHYLRNLGKAKSNLVFPDHAERILPSSNSLDNVESTLESTRARHRHRSDPMERNVFVHHIIPTTTSPSKFPSSFPSMERTSFPSMEPSNFPSVAPSSLPSVAPSIAEDLNSSIPTIKNTASPTVQPTLLLTTAPTTTLTTAPTTEQTEDTTTLVTSMPSADIGNNTNVPTVANDFNDTIVPTLAPSNSSNVFSIETFLLQALSDDEKIFVEGSPQNKALNNLLNMSSDWDPNDSDDQTEILQRYALHTLYFSTNGDDWKVNTGWTSESNPCGIKNENDDVEDAWFGVLCDDDFKIVEKLALKNNTLRGRLPSDIRGLSGLVRLEISDNQISGSLLESIGGLKGLSVLDVGTNFFTGTIPSSVGNLTSLLLLDFSSNFFSGTLPTEISQLKSLITFHVDSNFLGSGLPPELFDATKLVSLRMDNNQFTGSIPTEIGQLSNAIFLSLSKNALSGTIPADIGNLEQLEFFNATTNFIGGKLPDVFEGLVYLKSFEMALNFLTGTLPETLLLNTSVLENLNLAGNRIGEEFFLPDAIGQMTSLKKLDLSTNQFVGTIPQTIGGMVKLTDLRLDKNFLTGEIPANVTALTSIELLSLSGNSLTALPMSLANLDKLMVLQLSSNSFEEITGEVFTDLPNLETFDISKNKLDGDTLPDIFQSTSLRTLNLSFNELNATFDFSSILGLVNIENLHMASCSIASTLPDGIDTLQSLVTLDLDDNSLSGTIPSSLGDITSLEKILLGLNDLTGTIPPELSKLVNLKVLELQFNSLTGTIPAEFDTFSDLIFDIEGNSISENQEA